MFNLWREWLSSVIYGVTFRFSSTTNTTQILQARKQRTLRNKQFNNHNKQDKNNQNYKVHVMYERPL